MRTFEERFTAWIDGQLLGEELADFEREVAQRNGDAASEKEEALKLGSLLREYGASPAMTNREFFNHQLMDRIDAERPTKPIHAGEKEQGTWWGLPKMVWVGAACLVASILILPLIAPRVSKDAVVEDLTPLVEDKYFAEVLESHTSDPRVSATAIHATDDDLTVVWLDGLDYIPASNEITPSGRAD